MNYIQSGGNNNNNSKIDNQANNSNNNNRLSNMINSTAQIEEIVVDESNRLAVQQQYDELDQNQINNQNQGIHRLLFF